MSFMEFLQLAGTILGTLGVGAAIIFGMSNWLGKVWANRLMTKEKSQYAKELESLKKDLLQDIESYKIKLKKSEFIFEKEFEAASELVSLKRSFLPTYSHPDMDWGDACEEMALSLAHIESNLGDYLSKHGAVLDEEVVELIVSCIGIAGENKFEANHDVISNKAMNAAEEVYNKLNQAEKLLLKNVHRNMSMKMRHAC